MRPEFPYDLNSSTEYFFMTKIIRTVETTMKGTMATKTMENFQASANERTIQPIPRIVNIIKSANLKLMLDLIMSMFLKSF
jgi:hypothetical protein